MSFQPITPTGGLAGWRFLNATLDRQQESFAKSPVIERDLAYFRENIRSISSAQELVQDRRLLSVALGAFGLEEDINKQAFIRKVLEEGTHKPDSFAMRLVDRRYRDLSEAFGFGSPFGNRLQRLSFVSEITDNYKTRQFEAALGESDSSMRLALGFRREISAIADSLPKGDTAWLQILGSPPMKAVVESALGIPSEATQLDLDRQVSHLKERSAQVLGSSDASVFLDSSTVEKVIETYLARSSSKTFTPSTSGASAALGILQAGSNRLGSGTIEALLTFRN